MFTRQSFLTAFFERLRASGFYVQAIDEGDVAAEVSDPEGNPFCAITADGDIIYESDDGDRKKTFYSCIMDNRQAMGACSEFTLEQAECIGDECYKIFESNYILLAFRRSILWGYEFFTCKKVSYAHNSTRRFYHERRFYHLGQAKDDFARRSGLADEQPRFSGYELALMMECCSKRLMLDNCMDVDLENDISQLITKLEGYMPPSVEMQPHHFFADEREQA